MNVVEPTWILAKCKSERNIAILKTMLADPNRSETDGTRTIDGKVVKCRVVHYHVRRSAYEALRELGVDVERPIVETVVENRD